MAPTAYPVRRMPRREFLQVRGLKIQLTRWGPPPSATAAPVFLLHGWQDCADTFQFMVDGFTDDRPLVALDWRGFGRSEWSGDGYWFADYIADLEALLDLLSPGVPARLVGHSMGGNIAALYAGLRPGRVSCVVNLEGFGMERASSEQAPAQLRKWLDQVRVPPTTKDYESFEQLASLIAFRYPRFSAAQADFVARAWGEMRPDGRVHLLGDPRHRWINPLVYRREDAEFIWRGLRAPMLLLLGDASEYLPRLGADGSEEILRRNFPGVEIARVPGGGHMLHIERADLVASLVESFLSAH
jgi:pimeloyl-ACP methyl ester carboxylesterase